MTVAELIAKLHECLQKWDTIADECDRRGDRDSASGYEECADDVRELIKRATEPQ